MDISSISSSQEDYLEAISEIIDRNGHAHTKDIADRLGVKMPSVTNALQMLAARGLIRYQSHNPVELTSEGALAASAIRNRHASLKAFFSEILMLDVQEADATACRIEHDISETVLSRFKFLLEAISDREDCAGLREFLNDSMPKVIGSELSDLISLDKLPKGRVAEVVKIAEGIPSMRKFAELGIVPGMQLEFEGKAPLGDLLRIKVMGSSLSLRAGDARYIWVKLVD